MTRCSKHTRPRRPGQLLTPLGYERHALTTLVVVVHETNPPGVRQPMALCPAHLDALRHDSWAELDEVVGPSRQLACEACALLKTG